MMILTYLKDNKKFYVNLGPYAGKTAEQVKEIVQRNNPKMIIVSVVKTTELFNS